MGIHQESGEQLVRHPGAETRTALSPIGLVCENSPDFVARALDLLRRGEAYMLLRSQNDEARTRIIAPGRIEVPEPGSGWFQPDLDDSDSDDIAQVSFTSGTEGHPKAVLLTRRNLDDVTRRLIAEMEISSDIREYIGVPVYYSFGFGRCRVLAAVKGAGYLPPKGFDSHEFARLLGSGEVNALSAVPSLLRLLLDSDAVTEAAGKRLLWLEIGSQYMSAAEKARLKKLFPHARILQHYGLTEASRSTLLRIDQVEGDALESVGRPRGQVEMRMTSEGKIALRGPHTSACVMTADGATSPLDEEGWLTTNDLGRIVDGYLYYEGRADDVINYAGVKISPEALEERVRQLLGANPAFALARVNDPLSGDAVLLASTSNGDIAEQELLEAVARAAADYGVALRGAIRTLRVDELPLTATGKVQRKALAAKFQDQRERQDAPGSGASQDLLVEFRQLLGATEIRPDDTFTTLGGDSLRYIQASALLQRRLGQVPPDWENEPLVELARKSKSPERGFFNQIESLVVARAAAISAIVVFHSGLLQNVVEISGGAFFLLVAAGFSFSRFQLQRAIAEDKPWPALSIIPRIALPTMAFVFLMQVRKTLYFPAILLFSNFFGPPQAGEVGFWFIETFIQLHLVAFLMLSIAPYRRAFASKPYLVSLYTLAVCVAAEWLMPYVWNTAHLWDRVPHMKMWYFALGMCLFFGRDGKARIVNSVLLLALAASRLPQAAPSQALWIAGGGLLTIWAPRLTLPTWLAKALSLLAAASLFIYITHFTTLGVLEKRGFGYPVQIFSALAVGIVAWLSWERVTNVVVALVSKQRSMARIEPESSTTTVA